MKRTGLAILVVALAFTTVACEEIMDEIDMSQEDREALEDLIDGVGDAMNDASNGGAGNPGTDGEGDSPAEDGDPDDPLEADWSPSGFPPPPGQPTASQDQSDEAYCPAGARCGWASYDDDDGQAARDHYEELYGREADESHSRPTTDEDGNSYQAKTSTWRDETSEVTVYSDHHGTDVLVQEDS